MISDPPLVSILMPVKNASEYLRDCLDSILSQTLPNWELVCVDDHSSDSSVEVLQAYARGEDRFKIFENQGIGILPALKLALDQARGTFVTRMDADDIMKPSKLELLMAKLQECDVSIGLVEYFRQDGVLGDGYKKYEQWLNSSSLRGNTYDEIYKECTIPSPCWMMSRKKLLALGGFEGIEYPEDYDLAFRMYANNLSVGVVPEVLHLWRDHKARTSRTDANYADNRFLDLKLNRLLELDFKDGDLVLWGAGRKGKDIAVALNKRRIPFAWISGNKKKIGHSIYEQLVLDERTFNFSADSNVIVAIAGSQLEEVKKRVAQRSMAGHYFYFA